MKKTLSILLSVVLILTLFPLSGFEANATATPEPTVFYNAENWVELNSSGNQISWGATTVTTVNKDGANIPAVQLRQYNAFNHLIKFAVDENSKYTFSFDYKASVTGDFGDKKAAIKSLGVAPLKNNALIYRDYTTTDPAAIYTITPLYAWAGSYDGKVTDSTVNTAITDFNSESWYSVTFEFETGDNQELEFFLNPLTTTNTVNDFLYLANINLEKQIKPTTTSDDLNNASNWATYNQSDSPTGWWGKPAASTYQGKTSIKVSSYNILTTATELTVEQNTYYSISFEYCGSVKSPKVLKTVGISTIADGKIVHQATGDIYNSGAIGDSTDVWTTISFAFNSGANTALEFFILPSAGSDTPLYLANFSIEKLEGLNLVSNWTVLRSAGTVIDWMLPKTVSATKDGKSIHAIQITGNSAGSYVSSFDAKQKHMYRLSFDYHSANLGTLAPNYTPIFISCGVAPLNDKGEAIYRTHTTTAPAGIFTLHPAYSWEGSYSATDRVNNSSLNLNITEPSPDNWYNISFEFCSGANNKLEFYINPASLTSNAPIDLANFKLEDLGAYTSADTLNANENLYNSCGSITYEAVDQKDTNKGFRLPYIGSGIEFKVSGTDNVKAGFKLPALGTFRDYSKTATGSNEYITKYHTLRMKVWVDGVEKDDVIINGQYETTKWLTVAEDLNSNEEHTIKLVRATEASLGNTLILMGVLSGDGNLVDVSKTDKPYIEVYGDSISSGYGNIASGNYSNFNNDTSLYSYFDAEGNKLPSSEGSEKSNLNVSEYDFEDGTKTYAYLAAENLDADINVFSKFGLGITVYGGKADENTVTMAKWYPDLPKNKDADYVIINHITNDSKYYNSAAGLDKDELANKYCEFISTVRNDHEKAKIIVVYGIMSIYSTGENYYKTGEEAVLQAVATAKEKGDENVYALMLPKGSKGGAGHPDADEHLAASKLLTEFINGLGVIETQNSVGIRAKSTDKGQGIRVKNNISIAEIEGKNIVSYGAIAIRKGRMAEGVTLTFDTPNIATGVAYNTKSENCGGKIQTEPILREQTANDNIFSCVLINIPQKYYDDKYSVRSFAIDDAGNVYYGEVIEVSVFDVVYAILNGKDENDKITANDIVNEIIEADKTDLNNEITTYADWCTANNLPNNSAAASTN